MEEIKACGQFFKGTIELVARKKGTMSGFLSARCAFCIPRYHLKSTSLMVKKLSIYT